MNAREHIDQALLDTIDSSTEENGYFLNELPIGTKLKVNTRNTEYDIEIRPRSGEPDPDWLNAEVWMKGHHEYCPEFVKVNFQGSTWGSSVIKLRWVGVDMCMEFSIGDWKRITTSFVERITCLSNPKPNDVSSMLPTPR